MQKVIVFREKNKFDRVDNLNFLIQLKDKKNLNPLDLAAHGVTVFVDGTSKLPVLSSHMVYMNLL